MTARARKASVVLALALALASCGGDDEPAAELAPADPADPGDEATEEGDPTEGGEERYVVESGDTLSSIAARYGTTVDAIVEANDLDDPDRIDVGDELTIPSAP
jgi:nucleoid-associated protein YgaU